MNANTKSAFIKPFRPESLLNFGAGRRVPLILQSELSECGLACLAMISGYHGFETDLVALRGRFSVSSKGVSLKQLMAMASRIHLSPRALKVDPEKLDQVTLPCILHWGLNHFVVLKKIKNKKYVVNDPGAGERTFSEEEFNKMFTGVVLELIPTKSFEVKDERKKLSIRDFWSRITGLKRNLTQVVVLSLLLQLFTLASPLYMQTVVDDVLLRKDFDLLIVLAIGFGLLMVIQIFTNALREFVVLHLTNRLSMQMSANLFRHLIRLPMDYFSKRHMGDILSRFGSLGSVRSILTSGVVVAVVDGVMAILTLIAMFIYSVKLTLIVIAIVLLYAIIRWVLFHPFRTLSEESIAAGAKEQSHFMESLRAIQTIKLFQRENDRQNQWQNRLADVMNKDIQISRWTIGYGIINGILFGVENILIIFFAAKAVMGDVISLGMLYAFVNYKSRFVSSMDNLIAQWIEFKMLGLHLDRLADITYTPAEKIVDAQEIDWSDQDFEANNIDVFSLPEYSNQIYGKIEVKDLGYRYSEEESFVFRNLNFVIERGETVAITGPSGCGKSTLLMCLMGFIEPTEGEILIDDKPLKNQLSYRSQIAGVLQDDQLISGDILENICCYSPVVSLQKATVCAQLACIHNEISNMPMRYNTMVGDMGSNLSGGQKQRIILARALYRQPKILFLDEATSHLDVNNEMQVNENIRNLQITRVIVAHRSETIATAQRKIELSSAN